MSETIDLAKKLISIDSVTPEDKGCQALMVEYLSALGFNSTPLQFNDVTNLWSTRGEKAPLFVFAGHTDVVPTGPTSEWNTPPFEPTEKDGYLYGRGSADMKGSLAAMLVATKRFVEKHPNHKGAIGFLITSDEEGPAVDGTVRVIEWLEEQKIKLDYCLVGEPSSTHTVGDIIKNGRRGSLNGKLKIEGVQGHIAYPHLAENPIHTSLIPLAELSAQEWDQGNDFFPATSLQISNINSGTGATNVIPGHLSALFNFRYSTESRAEDLIAKTEAIFDKAQLNFSIDWNLSGEPFLTEPGLLVDACKEAIAMATDTKTELSTSGGTSDGRFIAPTGAQVVELGPCNATIHQVNECVKIEDLNQLTDIYEGILTRLLN